MRVEQLEEDQIKAADSVSNHKQATQLLQTELQDACAQVKDREGSIEILKEKLRETEVRFGARWNFTPELLFVFYVGCVQYCIKLFYFWGIGSG